MGALVGDGASSVTDRGGSTGITGIGSTNGFNGGLLIDPGSALLAHAVEPRSATSTAAEPLTTPKLNKRRRVRPSRCRNSRSRPVRPSSRRAEPPAVITPRSPALLKCALNRCFGMVCSLHYKPPRRRVAHRPPLADWDVDIFGVATLGAPILHRCAARSIPTLRLPRLLVERPSSPSPRSSCRKTDEPGRSPTVRAPGGE